MVVRYFGTGAFRDQRASDLIYIKSKKMSIISRTVVEE